MSSPSDAGDVFVADAARPPWSEKHVREGMEAAEFFDEHRARVEAEEADNQLIAMLVGLVIGLTIVLVVRLRGAK